MKYIINKYQYNRLVESKKKKKTITEMMVKVDNIDKNIKNKLMASKLKKELVEQYLKNELIVEQDIPKNLI